MLKFKLVQLESKDLENLISLIEREHTQDPEKWGDVYEALEVGKDTEVRWADWDIPEEELPESSIPLMKWGKDGKWMMSLPVPSSLVTLLSPDYLLLPK